MPENGTAPIDEEVVAELLETTGGDRAFLGGLIETYLEDAPRHLSAMRNAAAAGDAGEVARAAHALKGASGSMGATELSQQARAVEMAARDDDLSASEERIGTLEAEFERVASALREVAAGPSD